MPAYLGAWYNAVMSAPIPALSTDIRPRVDQLLNEAMRRGASDLHVEPAAHGFDLRFRIDGQLQNLEQLDTATGKAVVGRLMVMAHLLTYRLDVPQEGRISLPDQAELRIAVMPTSHGLRAAVRLPMPHMQQAKLATLGLPPGVLQTLEQFCRADSGMLVLTGPAGSGKTTTIYALLQAMGAQENGLSIITLEDPIERDLPGVTQIEVSPFGQLTYEKALRSLLRQDPQVLMLGEIRDAQTASLAVQATLSGHRLITTFHASTPGGAIARLLEMGIEPYQVTSALWAVVSQRLVRRSKPGGGYEGRMPLAEVVKIDSPLRAAILNRSDARTLQGIYRDQSGYQSLFDVGEKLLAQGETDLTELHRVIGDNS